VEIFDIFWAAFPPPAPIDVRFCTAKRTLLPVGPAKFDLNRCNESPLRGENPNFSPVRKSNTGSLPLRSILPVKSRRCLLRFLLLLSALHLFLTSYRQDAAMQQTAGIQFTHRPKTRFFAPQGRLVAPIRVKLCRTDGHLGPLGCAKFHLNRRRGVGMRPQNINNFHFLVKSRPVGATPLTDFQTFKGFYTPNYPTLAFQISCDSHHRLRSYC